jgi:2-succinyl-5-enolpyruvyl-6-hydroxy-3-cyclohexene-1-carboxylate synthase
MTDLIALRGLVDALVGGGVHDAVVCPGSRSTPLALALRAHPAIMVRVLLDERSAGFFALGMAKAARRPVAVLTTSGTAAANLLPAAVEASLGRVPLILLTADRLPTARQGPPGHRPGALRDP